LGGFTSGRRWLPGHTVADHDGADLPGGEGEFEVVGGRRSGEGLQFMSYWNNFFQAAIYLTDDKWKTLPLALAGFQSVNGTNTPLLMATTLVVTLPCVLIFFLAQRHIIGGISFSGNK
jgi:hypothetical protein